MAMSVSYAMVSGRLVQENRGGAVTRYVPDTLGSVIQTRDASGAQTSSTEFWPYGEVRTSSGTNPSPWGFIGTLGYFADTLKRLYVRARYYLANMPTWLTVDPLWPMQMPYAYAGCNPVTDVDPSGLQKQLPPEHLAPWKFGYGNYCGGDRNPVKWCNKHHEPLPTPWDALDKCCKPHDITYNASGCMPPFLNQSPECKKADDSLCKCAAGVDCDKVRPENVKACWRERAFICAACGATGRNYCKKH